LQQKVKKAIAGKADCALLSDRRRVGKKKALAAVAANLSAYIERKPESEEKANRDNLTFTNRRNQQKIKYIPISNRDQNTMFGSPNFRPSVPHSLRDLA
jgi:hypothetical protein